MSKRVLVLGSTGSVGRQALQVLLEARTTHKVVGLSAATSASRLGEQARAFAPEAVCLVGDAPLDVPPGCRVLRGPDGLVELVRRTHPDIVLAAITGAAGLLPTLEAAASGAVVALANKESLVLAGHLVKRAVRDSGGSLVPVDSEHSAIAQCLQGGNGTGLRRLILTASGGPFRGRRRDQMRNASVEEALAHPNWAMGPRITIDSATMMNKALEIVEACHLFDVPHERVEVVVHPQSVVHSMVEFVDGSVIAQLGPPDMRVPIRWSLGWPGRLDAGMPPVDVTTLGPLTFERPDTEAFPCLALGHRVAAAGGLAGTVMNAANEVAVEAFLAGVLPFGAIAEVVAQALERFDNASEPEVSEILDTDLRIRAEVRRRLLQTTG